MDIYKEDLYDGLDELPICDQLKYRKLTAVMKMTHDLILSGIEKEPRMAEAIADDYYSTFEGRLNRINSQEVDKQKR